LLIALSIVSLAAVQSTAAYAQCEFVNVEGAPSPAKASDENFKKLTNCIKDLQAKLNRWNSAPSQPGSKAITTGPGPVTTMCPEDSYVVGIVSWGNPGGQCYGCFNAAQVLCKKLNLN
jgi:hypothetical protein